MGQNVVRRTLSKGVCELGCCEEYCQQMRLWARILLRVFPGKGIMDPDAAISILSKRVCDESFSCN